MKKYNLLLLLAALSFSPIAFSADSIIGTDGSNQLVDNAHTRWNAEVAYTTNGNGDVVTLGGELASGDNYFGDPTSGARMLLDNSGRRWNLQVLYTTDGAGNVIPISAGGSGAVSSVFTRTGDVVAQSGDYNTSQVTENTNLYYTQARFDSAFTAKSTTNLSEGTNLYFTNARGIAALLTGYTSGAGTVSSADSILSAIQKLNGNTAAKFTLPSFTAGSIPLSDGTTLIQDNTNFFFDATNHSLSVGPGPHPATSADLAISSQASDTKVGLSVFTTSSNNAVQISSQNAFSLAALTASASNSPSFNFERARGTLVAKTQALAGDILGSFIFNGYTGSADGSFAAGFGAIATENQASGHAGAEMLFETTSNGSTTLTPRMVIDQDGTVEPFADATTAVGKNTLRFKDAHFSSVLQMGVQGSGVTPACGTNDKGTLALTSVYLLCVCNGTSWVTASTGTVACTF